MVDSGHTNIGQYFRKCGEMWKMSTITFITDVCSGASLYHVALIVLLRCFAIAKPMTFKKWHKRFGKTSIYLIWILNVAIVLVPTVICTKGFTTYDSTFFDDNYLKLYGGAWDAVQHITFTTPILLIIIFYFSQLYLLKSCCGNKGDQNNIGESKYKKKSMEKMIHMVTIGTLLCYSPYIAWMQYNIIMISKGKSEDVFDSIEKVSSLHGMKFLQFLSLFIYLSHIINNKQFVSYFLYLGIVSLHWPHFGWCSELHQPIYLRRYYSQV